MDQMTEREIIEQFMERKESAIAAAQEKYGRYCSSIAYNILFDAEDAEECLNDTWLRAWNSIPPEKPENLQSYLGCITRNLAIATLRAKKALKRAGTQFALSLDELSDSLVLSDNNVEQELDRKALSDAINRFLDELTEEKRNMFIQRYFYMDSIAEIAKHNGMRESRVKVALFRMRGALKLRLEEEDIL